MKKTLSLLIVLLFAFTAFSCALQPADGPAGTAEQTNNNDPETGAQTAAETETDAAAETETVAETGTETETETVTETETGAETQGGTGPEPAGLKSFDGFDAAFIEFIEQTEKDNYIISPLSFRYALGMAMAGANGNTLDQFLKGFGINDLNAFENYIKSFNSFEEGFTEKVRRDLEEYDEAVKKGVSKDRLDYRPGSLRTANSVWKREDLADFATDYKLHLEMYNAEHYTFTPDDIVARANDWANKKTEGMIPKILSDDYDAKGLAVVLMNALYYKNCWKYEFNKCGELPFTTADGAVLKKNYINSTETYGYYKDEKTELVVVGMNNSVNMIVVLGDTADLQNKIKSAEYKKVSVYLPEFEIETSLENKELCSFLLSLGITDAFTPGSADFGKMTDDKNDFYIDDIIQKAKIKLDETGVEAAAVTAIAVKNYAVPDKPIEFKADKPFHFYIVTGQSGWTETSGITLFEGRLSK